MVMNRMDTLDAIRKSLVSEEGFDLLKGLVSQVVHELMDAEVDGICGAGFRERSEDRTNSRNGYRSRRWDTRAGSIDLNIPKLRKGSYFPEWLLDPRRRSEKALVSVVAECYVKGVSTRRVDGIVKALGIEGISKSQVSELAKSLDAAVEEFRSRPLDQGPYVYVWMDAMTQRVREGGRVVNVVTVIATGINQEGKREILGFDVVTSEDGPAWLAFLRSLVSRGLSGTLLVISDAHPGLKGAISSALPGASWQRCRTHFLRNLLTRVPKAAQQAVAALVRSIYDQPDAPNVFSQHERVVAQLEENFPDAARMLDEARDEILAFAHFPKEHWRKIRSNNPQERLNREIRRRSDVVGIFPNRCSIVRLVGSLLAEQNDEWIIARRAITLEGLAKAQATVIQLEQPKKTKPKKRTKKLPKAA